MKEKLILAISSAVAGGALSAALSMANTAGRLTSVEKTLERIELRLDAIAPRR